MIGHVAGIHNDVGDAGLCSLKRDATALSLWIPVTWAAIGQSHSLKSEVGKLLLDYLWYAPSIVLFYYSIAITAR